MALKSQTQRSLLLAFIISIAFCGLLAIYCLLIGTFSGLQERIILTTVTMAMAAIMALGCAIPLEQRRWHPLGWLSVSAVGLALILVLFAVWLDYFEILVKVTALAALTAFGLTQTALLALARLRRGYEWVRIATIIAIASLMGMLGFAILIEPPSSDLMLRIMGVLAICNVCGSITVPILHRVSAIRAHDLVQTFSITLQLICPRCAATQQVHVGRSKCAGCGLRFRIEIEEEHCPKCGYPLYKLESGICPECGTPVASGV